MTHDARAAAYADRVVFLRDGRLERQIVFPAGQPLAERVRAVLDHMEALEV